MRLNSDHHELLLDFAEQNTQIITNSWTGLAGSQNSKHLWDILGNKLNSLGYGTLSVTEYKRRLTDWKSKTKSKAANLRYQVVATGGGPKIEIQLTHHEKRLLALMGNISYEGDNVQEIGGVLSQPSTVTLSTPLTTQKNNFKNSNTQIHSDFTSTPRSTPRYSIARVLQTDGTPSLVSQSQSDGLEFQNENEFQYDTFFSENLAYTEKTKTLSEKDIDISFVDHNYTASASNTNSVGNTDTFKKRKISQPKQNPSKSSERRARVKDLSTEIKDMNNETLSVLKDIRGEFLNVNRNLNNISSSLSTLTKAVCTIAEKLN